MASVLNPYINFDGTAREALEFYKEVFGGELNLNTFGDFGADQAGDPEHKVDANKIMHGQLTTTSGFTLMAADTPPGMPIQAGNNISVSLSGDDRAELKGYWDKLADGGQVAVPLEKQMWGDEFGMCVDKFGISWLVNIAGS
ncbi:VOC family protein [Labedaea rhizosphaerae]|uniref:PhnB protein n=1 Tax=Labedaea rhizosphaerae TaxID=598644 RepID=A0A4R6SCC9_LABRH|nr:VOC family protein [Labedaea rhizosphaerae]TDP96686.1 PhnB protein [Labedaea rhizosphaerae]